MKFVIIVIIGMFLLAVCDRKKCGDNVVEIMRDVAISRKKGSLIVKNPMCQFKS
jgi:hypothetical protein